MAFDIYRGADKSLARPERKQANFAARMAFDIYKGAGKSLVRPEREQVKVLSEWRLTFTGC